MQARDGQGTKDCEEMNKCLPYGHDKERRLAPEETTCKDLVKADQQSHTVSAERVSLNYL